MNRRTAVFVAVFLVAFPCFGFPVTIFTDTDTFIQGARDLVIVKCVSVPRGTRPEPDLAQVDVLKVLKGDKRVGRLTAGTAYPMEVGKLYLLMSQDGGASGNALKATPELSVVQLPAEGSIKELEGKTVKEQVVQIFKWRRDELAKTLRPPGDEKKLLDRALP